MRLSHKVSVRIFATSLTPLQAVLAHCSCSLFLSVGSVLAAAQQGQASSLRPLSGAYPISTHHGTATRWLSPFHWAVFLPTPFSLLLPLFSPLPVFPSLIVISSANRRHSLLRLLSSGRFDFLSFFSFARHCSVGCCLVPLLPPLAKNYYTFFYYCYHFPLALLDLAACFDSCTSNIASYEALTRQTGGSSV